VTVFSVHDRISGWVADELALADPMDADEFGHHVTMAAVQTPNGDAIVWMILITLRSPYLGQDALGSVAKLPANIPPEPAVRMAVKRNVEGLRKAFGIKKAEGFPEGNGHSKNELPPGLRGLKL
jgi:hypothetical protein